jgi:streptomycin 6-kinase
VSPIEVPAALAASLREYESAISTAWLAALPALAADFLDRWNLRLDGKPAHGVVALVLPVIRSDDTPAVLKLQPVNEETLDEPACLRLRNGNGTALLLDHDRDTGTMLLERLNADRPLSTIQDDMEALRILSELLARLVAMPAPDGMRRLGDIARVLLERTPKAVAALPDAEDRRLLETCAATVHDLLGEPGNQLLHWDLHYDNVLAGDREPWLAIDPKPLAGDPAFELLPALFNRWDDVVACGDVRRAVLRRFDLMTEILSIDRSRAVGWTLGRVLQNCIWMVESGELTLQPEHVTIARALLTVKS